MWRSHLRQTFTLNHVPDFLYQGGEPKIKFLLRNLLNLFNYTAPWQFTDRRPFEKVAAALAVGAIGITAFVRSRARIPLLMTLILLCELAGAGLAGRYPFGGFLRHQFILFPFLVLSAGICFDRLIAWAGPPRVAPVIAAIAAGVVLAVGSHVEEDRGARDGGHHEREGLREPDAHQAEPDEHAEAERPEERRHPMREGRQAHGNQV